MYWRSVYARCHHNFLLSLHEIVCSDIIILRMHQPIGICRIVRHRTSSYCKNILREDDFNVVEDCRAKRQICHHQINLRCQLGKYKVRRIVISDTKLYLPVLILTSNCLLGDQSIYLFIFATSLAARDICCNIIFNQSIQLLTWKFLKCSFTQTYSR